MTTPTPSRAYQYDSYGDVTQELVLRSDVPLQPLAGHQTRIRVHYAALNPIDANLVEFVGRIFTGSSPTPERPYGFGFDAAGVVAEVGPGVSKFRVGDEVFVMTPWSSIGTLADFVVVEDEFVAKKPTNLPLEQAAGVPLAALTAYQALFEHTALKKSEKVLILGGSSAVGQFAVQLARAVGAEVIATTSSRNAELVKSLGASSVVDYATEKWAEAVESRSVDVLLDCGVESDAWNTGAQHVLKPDSGRFVTLLPMQQPVKESQSGVKLVGEVLVHASGTQLAEIAKFIERGEVTSRVDSVFAFEQLQDAIKKLKTRHACGKIVVRVA